MSFREQIEQALTSATQTFQKVMGEFLPKFEALRQDLKAATNDVADMEITIIGESPLVSTYNLVLKITKKDQPERGIASDAVGVFPSEPFVRGAGGQIDKLPEQWEGISLDGMEDYLSRQVANPDSILMRELILALRPRG